MIALLLDYSGSPPYDHLVKYDHSDNTTTFHFPEQHLSIFEDLVYATTLLIRPTTHLLMSPSLYSLIRLHKPHWPFM